MTDNTNIILYNCIYKLCVCVMFNLKLCSSKKKKGCDGNYTKTAIVSVNMYINHSETNYSNRIYMYLFWLSDFCYRF